MVTRTKQKQQPVPTETGEAPASNGQAPGPEATKPAAEQRGAAESPAPARPTALEALATRLEALAEEAKQLGEPTVAKVITYGIKSARWADKQRKARHKRVGGLVQQLQAQGLSAEEIIARLTQGGA